jgi:hypothetical protein
MKVNQWLVMAGAAAVMSLGTNQLVAQPSNGTQGGGGRQGRGNMDPAQRQQQMMDRLKETLEVSDDAEWKAMQPLVQKVADLGRELAGDRMRAMFGRRGGNNAQPADQQGQQRRGGFGGTPSPEADALQKAIDSKASKAEMKAALDKYMASRKAKQAALEQAQADLRKVLTSRQEAIATLNGLL